MMLESLARLASDTRYELPPEGTTLARYVARRMHKTALLRGVAEMARSGQAAEALAQAAIYAAGASASFGPAYYQPDLGLVGEPVREADPATGAQVSVTLETGQAPYRIACVVEMPGGELLTGREQINGTTLGFRGLGMPAPSRFTFALPRGAYSAYLQGVIVSELAPRPFDKWRVRGYGTLDLNDTAGNTGTLSLNRSGEAVVIARRPDGSTLTRRYSFAAG
jgi:hypothetical protein